MAARDVMGVAPSAQENLALPGLEIQDGHLCGWRPPVSAVIVKRTERPSGNISGQSDRLRLSRIGAREYLHLPTRAETRCRPIATFSPARMMLPSGAQVAPPEVPASTVVSVTAGPPVIGTLFKMPSAFPESDPLAIGRCKQPGCRPVYSATGESESSARTKICVAPFPIYAICEPSGVIARPRSL
jgi:hypothetical protein